MVFVQESQKKESEQNKTKQNFIYNFILLAAVPFSQFRRLRLVWNANGHPFRAVSSKKRRRLCSFWNRILNFETF